MTVNTGYQKYLQTIKKMLLFKNHTYEEQQQFCELSKNIYHIFNTKPSISGLINSHALYNSSTL